MIQQESIPGIQYSAVEFNNQFQKYLYIVLQTLSGIDPSSPPNFNPHLNSEGDMLFVDMPFSPFLMKPEYLTSERTAWMRRVDNYEADRAARLTGLGAAIADMQQYLNNQVPAIKLQIPLTERCEEVVGNYSICNFPSPMNEHGQRYYPVFVEFKLLLSTQKVKKTTAVASCVWLDDDDVQNDDDEVEVTTCSNAPNFVTPKRSRKRVRK